MNFETFFYNCSKQYVNRINEELYDEIGGVIRGLPARDAQSEMNRDLFWILTSQNWAFDSTPPNIGKNPSRDLRSISANINAIKNKNNRSLWRLCRARYNRHTFASRLVKRGVDLIIVKELLGHASVTTTQRYTHSRADEKLRAVETLSQRA